MPIICLLKTSPPKINTRGCGWSIHILLHREVNGWNKSSWCISLKKMISYRHLAWLSSESFERQTTKGLFDLKDFHRIFEGLEFLGIFSTSVVWFVGLNHVGFFPKDSFVLHFTGILTSTPTSWKKSFVFSMTQSNKLKSYRDPMDMPFQSYVFPIPVFLQSYESKRP